MNPNRQLEIDEKYMAAFWEKLESDNPFLLDGEDFVFLGDIAQRYMDKYKELMKTHIPEPTPSKPYKHTLYESMAKGLLDNAK